MLQGLLQFSIEDILQHTIHLTARHGYPGAGDNPPGGTLAEALTPLLEI